MVDELEAYITVNGLQLKHNNMLRNSRYLLL